MREFLYVFEWDEHNLAFRRVGWSFRRWCVAVLRVMVIGASVGIMSVGPAWPLWERFFVESTLRHISALRTKAAEIAREIAVLEESCLGYWYERAQHLYRPLLGEAPMPESEWAGHMGGAPMAFPDRALYRGRRLLAEYQHLHQLLAAQAERLAFLPCLLPTEGVIVSGYGVRRDPFYKDWRMHFGLDIAAPYGTPVRATAAGRIRLASWDVGGYGLQVEIDHLNGLVTKYAHLSKTVVQPGQYVRRNQIIGYVGSTGYSTAPHLHYEVIERGIKVNPQKYILLPQDVR
ncbi:MAG: M23 family metallopeptidase [Bacteroidia bacterium]